MEKKTTLSDKERDAVIQLRENVKDMLKDRPSMFNQDWYLVRWVRARKLNVKAATEQLRASLKWRDETKPDEQLKAYNAPEIFEKYWSGGLLGETKAGVPVLVDSFAKLDLLGLIRSTSKAEVLKHWVMWAEGLEDVLDQACQKHNREIRQFVLIMNIEGTSSKQLRPAFMKVYGDALRVLQDNYPERVSRIFIINTPAPRLLAFGWNLLKWMFDEGLREKMVFCGKNWQDDLLQEIDASVLPDYFGGERKECPSIKPGGEVPPELFKDNSDAYTKWVVPRGQTFSHEIKVTKEGSMLSWDFFTESRNIQFFVTLTKPLEEEEVVVAKEKLESHVSSVQGELVCDFTGIYKLVWDNSFSWLYSKSLSFKVELAEPQSH
mmetsp:Transcript_28604/g.56206  ORF Transcript_28604/g.56206 Transcript_28604/m.56206 type:complete len:378 (-) Transcript_28604:143-1276(-)